MAQRVLRETVPSFSFSFFFLFEFANLNLRSVLRGAFFLFNFLKIPLDWKHLQYCLHAFFFLFLFTTFLPVFSDDDEDDECDDGYDDGLDWMDGRTDGCKCSLDMKGFPPPP